MAWGKKKDEQRRDVATNGGTLSGRDARRATQQGGLGDDQRVRDTQGRVTGDFRSRTRRPTNEHGV